MPRLPGPEALGQAPNLRPTGGAPRVPNIDFGDQLLARGFSNLASAFDDIETGNQNQADEVDLARAQSTMTTRLLELNRSLENDPDYDTYGERYAQGAAAAQAEAAAGIRNRRILDRWTPRADLEIARGLDHIIGRANGMRRDAQATEMNTILGDLSQAYIQAPGDDGEPGNDPAYNDTARAIIRRNMEEQIALAGRIVSPRQLQQLQEQLQGLDEADARAMVGREGPLSVWQELTGANGRATQPDSGQVSDRGLGYIRRFLPPLGQATSPQARAQADTELREQAGRMSALITENLQNEDGTTVPLTQLQRDALVGIGVRRGEEALREVMPSVRAGNWQVAGQIGRTIAGGGSLTTMEQPAGVTGAGGPPRPGREGGEAYEQWIERIGSARLNDPAERARLRAEFDAAHERGDVLPSSRARDYLNYYEQQQGQGQGQGRGGQGQQDNRETPLPTFSGRRSSTRNWGNDPTWRGMGAVERAAAMALLEADSRNGRIDMQAATNALGAIINRADRERQDLGDHVSRSIYQPIIEPDQYARLAQIVGSPQHRELIALARARLSGETPDWVNGATHFLAHERTMLRLEAQNPQLYRSWRGWTGFNSATGEYNGVIMRDGSHAFLSPEGVHSAQFGGPGRSNVTAQANTGTTTDAGTGGRSAPQPSTPGPDSVAEELGDMLTNRAPSSRFANMPAERRRILQGQLETQMRPQLEEDIRQSISSILEGREPPRDPQGRTALERATGILTPNRFEHARLRWENAVARRQALGGINLMTPEEMGEHLTELPPGLRTPAERIANDAMGLRRTDPARLVEGGNLQGADRRTRYGTGPDGQPVPIGDEDADHRMNMAPEMAAIREELRRLYPGLVLDTEGGRIVVRMPGRLPDVASGRDANGNPAFSPEQRQEQARRREIEQAAWARIMDARLAAQARLGIPENGRSPILRSEALELLAIPRGATAQEAQQAILAAADRASARYGPRAQEVMTAAIGFLTMAGDARDNVRSQIISRLAMGNPITRNEMENLLTIQNLAAQQQAWMGGGRGFRQNATEQGMVPVIPVDSENAGSGASILPPTWQAHDIGARAQAAGADLQQMAQAGPNAVGQRWGDALNRGDNSRSGGGASEPTPEQVEWLRANIAQRWQIFERDFGDGSAARYLQQEEQPRPRRRPIEAPPLPPQR